MKKLYKIPEIASILRISTAKAYRIIKDEGIVPVRIGPRSNRITQDHVNMLMKKWQEGID